MATPTWDQLTRPILELACERPITRQIAIEQAVGKVESTLQTELLEQLLAVNPYRFERIVLDLLFAMGYGGSREEAAQVTQKSNDEGIDGVINEDRLGLDVIYVQAKRWQGNVSHKVIHNRIRNTRNQISEDEQRAVCQCIEGGCRDVVV